MEQAHTAVLRQEAHTPHLVPLRNFSRDSLWSSGRKKTLARQPSLSYIRYIARCVLLGRPRISLGGTEPGTEVESLPTGVRNLADNLLVFACVAHGEENIVDHTDGVQALSTTPFHDPSTYFAWQTYPLPSLQM